MSVKITESAYIASVKSIQLPSYKIVRCLRLFGSVGLLIVGATALFAQSDSLRTNELPTVYLTAERLPVLSGRSPLAETTLRILPTRIVLPQLQLQPYLNGIPGLYAQNATNYAQDLRISLRGFGARSPFGIRGVRVVVDGIPETTPDGQAQLDNLNLTGLRRLRVLRGAAAVQYGNASGGAILLDSELPYTTGWQGRVGSMVGSFGTQKHKLDIGGVHDDLRWAVRSEYVRSEGYRAHARLRTWNTNLRGEYRFNERMTLRWQLNYTDSPTAEDPGGLTRTEAEMAPQTARDRNRTFDASEAIRHGKAGLSFRYDPDRDWSYRLYGFYAQRSFRGRLPFEFGGWVALDRRYGGQGGQIARRWSGRRWVQVTRLGYDLAAQTDDRQRFFNQAGERGMPTLAQDERFGNLGTYLLHEAYQNDWTLTAGLRFDANRIGLDDRLLSNGDGSDRIAPQALNYSLGVLYRWRPALRVFGSWRTSFETPALSEYAADPDGSGGFNTDLRPQYATHYEAGLKGGGPANAWAYELAVFYVRTRNDLIPFELEAFAGRTFFRNAGSTRRRGLEASARYTWRSRWRVRGALTLHDLRYRDYRTPAGDFGGRRLPGVPATWTFLQLQYYLSEGLNVRLDHRYVGPQFADDANAVRVAAYHVWNFRIGGPVSVRGLEVFLYGGVQNLFDRAYFDNLRPNAFGERYYEPAPGRNGYVGFRVGW